MTLFRFTGGNREIQNFLWMFASGPIPLSVFHRKKNGMVAMGPSREALNCDDTFADQGFKGYTAMTLSGDSLLVLA